ncbi:MAG: type I-E CRISPR-associated endonuclease Cas1e [Candidatus Acetothermia bacterium]
MRLEADLIPLNDRQSYVFLGKGRIDVKDGAFVVIDKEGVRTQIPVGGLACVLLQPGTRISHAAVQLASENGCLLVWIGDGAVRLYSAAKKLGRPDNTLYQAKLALNGKARLQVVREMFRRRFDEEPPRKRSVDQLRGIEGSRVKKLYSNFARRYGVDWTRRKYDPKDWSKGDLANRCLSAGMACLYGVTEAAIHIAGYDPSIGFLHVGKRKSFVYDIADIYKFDLIVPKVFEIVSKHPSDAARKVRREARDSFRQANLLKTLIDDINDILDAGELDRPETPDYAIGPKIEE